MLRDSIDPREAPQGPVSLQLTPDRCKHCKPVILYNLVYCKRQAYKSPKHRSHSCGKLVLYDTIHRYLTIQVVTPAFGFLSWAGDE